MKSRLFPPACVALVVNSQLFTPPASCQAKKSIDFIRHVMDWDWYKPEDARIRPIGTQSTMPARQNVIWNACFLDLCWTFAAILVGQKEPRPALAMPRMCNVLSQSGSSRFPETVIQSLYILGIKHRSSAYFVAGHDLQRSQAFQLSPYEMPVSAQLRAGQSLNQ
jgi:hypothetical protein